MIEVKLFTGDGQYVVTALVPPFLDNAWPEVLIWGTRCFIRQHSYTSIEHEYWEGFAVAVVKTKQEEKI